MVGVDPEVMGIGPAVAIPKALQAADLSIDDIDHFENNEALVDAWLPSLNCLLQFFQHMLFFQHERSALPP